MTTLGRVLGIAATLIFVSACGGGGGGGGGAGGGTQPPPGGTQPPPTQNVSMGGIWYGIVSETDRYGSSVTEMIAITTASGDAFFVIPDWLMNTRWGDSDGLYPASLSSSGSNFSGVIHRVDSHDIQDDRNPAERAGTISGQIAARQSMWLSFSWPTDQVYYGAWGEGSLAYSPGYERGSSLTTLTGDWELDGIPVTVTISPQGRIDFPIAECELHGQISLIDTRYALYGVEIRLTPCSEFPDGAMAKGLAFEPDSNICFHDCDRRNLVMFLREEGVGSWMWIAVKPD